MPKKTPNIPNMPRAMRASSNQSRKTSGKRAFSHLEKDPVPAPEAKKFKADTKEFFKDKENKHVNLAAHAREEKERWAKIEAEHIAHALEYRRKGKNAPEEGAARAQILAELNEAEAEEAKNATDEDEEDADADELNRPK